MAGTGKGKGKAHTWQIRGHCAQLRQPISRPQVNNSNSSSSSTIICCAKGAPTYYSLGFTALHTFLYNDNDEKISPFLVREVRTPFMAHCPLSTVSRRLPQPLQLPWFTYREKRETFSGS